MRRGRRCWRELIVLLITLVLFSINPKSVASAQTVTGTITVGNSPSWVAVNPQTNRVYVTNFQSNTVSVIQP